MIIEFDVGNSRVKWRTLSELEMGERVGETRYRPHAEISAANEALLLELTGAEMIRVSSVADSLKPALKEIAAELGAGIEFAHTVANCAGVTNSYAQPSAMGVDRWLAMLAAFNAEDAQQPCVVIDSGTSLTIDFVAANGQHLGGLILPGKQLLLNSLSRNTEKVLFDPSQSAGELLLGCSTQEAVLNGAVHMMVGAVHQAIQSAQLPAEGSRYYLSGGDAPMLQRYLNVETNLVPDLVLDGLRYSLP